MELILHLGAHRTGTTALQRALMRRRKALAAQGVAIWGPTVMRDAISGPAMRITRVGIPNATMRAARDAARQELAKRLQQDRARGIVRVIVSDENLIGNMSGNIRAAALYPDAAKRLTVLADLLPVAPTRIYFAVRGYTEYWASIYAHTALRQGVPDFADVGPDVLGSPRGWPQVLSDTHAAFPKSDIRVWVYSGAKGALDKLIHDMVGPVEAPFPRIRADKRNQRLGAVAMQHALELRESAPSMGTETLINRAMQAAGDDQERFMPFRRRARLALRERYANDLAALKAGGVPAVSVLGAAA